MVMKFIEKIRKLTEEANSIKHAYPLIAETIKENAMQGSYSCYMQLIPEQIEALRAKGFTMKEASFLFDFGYDIEW